MPAEFKNLAETRRKLEEGLAISQGEGDAFIAANLEALAVKATTAKRREELKPEIAEMMKLIGQAREKGYNSMPLFESYKDILSQFGYNL